MPRKTIKKANEKFSLNPFGLILRGLTTVGRPVYFLVSHFVLFLLFVFYRVGRGISKTAAVSGRLIYLAGKKKGAKKSVPKTGPKQVKITLPFSGAEEIVGL